MKGGVNDVDFRGNNNSIVTVSMTVVMTERRWWR